MSNIISNSNTTIVSPLTVSNTLVIYSSLNVTGDLNFTGNLINNGSSVNISGAYSQWVSTGTNIFYASGNVAIGSTNPSSMITLYGSTNSSLGIEVNNINNGSASKAELKLNIDSSLGTTRLSTHGAGFTSNGAYLGNSGLLEADFNLSNGLGIVSKSASGNIRFYTGGATDSNERIRITTTGNVGIGVTNPLSKFIVSNGSNSNIVFDTLSGANDGYMSIGFNGGWNNDDYIINNLKSRFRLLQDTRGAVDRFFIDYFVTQSTRGILFCGLPNGNVGIGTNNPGYGLDVVGTVGFKNTLAVTGNVTASGTLTTVGAVNLQSTLAVTSNVTSSGTLIVSKDLTAGNYKSKEWIIAGPTFGTTYYKKIASTLSIGDGNNWGSISIKGIVGGYPKDDSGIIDIELITRGGISWSGSLHTTGYVSSVLYYSDIVIYQDASGGYSIYFKYFDFNANNFTVMSPNQAVLTSPSNEPAITSPPGTLVVSTMLGSLTHYLVRGNVGIGITNPGYKLDVVGTVRIHDGNSNYLLNLGSSGTGVFRSAYIYGNGTNMEIANQQNGNLIFINNNSERMRIANNGNVGIGLTNPSNKLEVVDTQSTTIKIRATDSTTACQLQFQNDNASTYAALYLNGTATGVNQNYLHMQNNAGAIYILPKLGTITYNRGRFEIQNDSTLDLDGNAVLNFKTSAGDMGYFYMRNSDDYLVSSQRMLLPSAIINSAVGIGTTNPATFLHIGNGTTSSTGVLIQNNLTNSGTRPGITAIAQNYEIRGIGAPTTTDDGFLRLSAGGGTTTSAQASIDISGYSTNADMNNNILFRTAASERMRITGGGNVGIGTSSPSAPLEVIGTVRVKNTTAGNNNVYLGNTAISNQGLFAMWNRGSDGKSYFINQKGLGAGGFVFGEATTSDVLTTNMVINADGNVGIGIAAPESRLDVRGPLAGYSGDTVLLSLGMSNLVSAQIGGVDVSVPPSGTFRGELAFYTRNHTSIPERMRITADGNVGIGTTNPSEKLHIKEGNLLLETISTSGVPVSNIILKETGYNDKFWIGCELNGFNDSNKLYIGSNTSGNPSQSDAKLTILHSSGNVGIGTTNPQSLLHMYKASGNELRITTSDGQISRVGMYEEALGSLWGAFIQYNGSPDYLEFGHKLSGTDNRTMYLTQSGNLVVSGLVSDASGVAMKQWSRRVNNSGNASVTYYKLANLYNGGGGGPGDGSLNIRGTLGGYEANIQATFDITVATRGSRLCWGSLNSSVSSLASLIGRMDFLLYLNSSGTYDLYMVLKNNTYQAFDFTVQGCGSNVFILYNPTTTPDTAPSGGSETISSILSLLNTYTIAGNVGIGTTNPATRLNIVGSGTTAELLRYGNGTSEIYSGADDSNGPWFGTRTNHNLRITTNASTKMTLDTSGNVGIGTTYPAQKLHIRAGNLLVQPNDNTACSIYIANASNNREAVFGLAGGVTDFFTSTGPGDVCIRGTSGQKIHFGLGTSAGTMCIFGNNVGIGTTGPTYKLDIDGDIRATLDILYWSAFEPRNVVGSTTTSGNRVYRLNTKGSTNAPPSYLEVYHAYGLSGLTYSFGSDERIKKNIIPSILKSIENIRKMKFISFNFKNGFGDSSIHYRIGLSAQQLVNLDEQYVFKFYISNEDSKTLGTDYIYHLNTNTLLLHGLKAIQEVDFDVQELKHQNEETLSDIGMLKNKVELLEKTIDSQNAQIQFQEEKLNQQEIIIQSLLARMEALEAKT